MIKSLEGRKKFIVGGEESYGYLIGDAVRDKDAISSCAMLAEMTAWAKDNGMGLFDLLLKLYEQFGYYRESLISITKKGKSGAEEIQAMMKDMRENPPQALAGSPLKLILDYKSSEGKNVKTGETFALDFPKSNVLQFLTEDGTKVSARPSGTEPKIKFYFSVKQDLPSADAFNDTTQALKGKIARISEELGIKE